MRVCLWWACSSAAKLMDLERQSRSSKRGNRKARLQLRALPEALQQSSEELKSRRATGDLRLVPGEWGVSRIRDGVRLTGLGCAV